MFLLGNMRKCCNGIFTFIVNGIFESIHSKVFLKIVLQFQVYLRNFCWGLISSKHETCLFAVLEEVGSFRGDFLSSILLISLFVWRTAVFGELPLMAAHNFKYTVHFTLTWKESFRTALFVDGLLINIWYCINCLFNINSALATYRGFPLR